ncbi:MAG: DEAD/DEAH box helicase [Cardiobacterium sp.]
MSNRILHDISRRLSLRPPQAESLAKLAQALDAAPTMVKHERDVAAILAALKGLFPTLSDFEREFPSLCFALATGVGKTRLMGACIAYLHLRYGNNFFVLAPNLTIYNKLIADFTPNTPKYVFKGIAEFAQQPPLVITGDNYDQSGATVDVLPRGFSQDVRINIFNIAKINSEVRGGKEPRIKRMREVLGDSYFNHLANLPDLVLLMDESHRYRAQAGMRAINELKPLFGLEFTATPFVEAGKGQVPFRNVIMDYPLARAMADGFVKEPAVATRRNFKAGEHSPEEIEQIKLEDGVRLHETTKIELLTYARENGVEAVKPFMLVIARDTTHAAQLKALLESPQFFAGRYAGKVIQVDSSKSGKDEEEMVARLLAVESRDEPTEIVIYVNMLKEGWDVTNLYTIVPLRAANARTLVEQSIGRGLRLPYGKRTGVKAVDWLHIVAHDKFQEIIDEANRGDSLLRLQQVILDAPAASEKKESVQVAPTVETRLGLVAADDVAPVFSSEAEKAAARVTLEVIEEYETRRDLLPTSAALRQPEVQAAIAAEVTARLQPKQGELLPDATLDVAAVVATTAATVMQQTIDIPRISVVPTGEVRTGFHPFSLDVSGLHLQPGEQELVIQGLHSNEQTRLTVKRGITEQRAEDYIVRELVDYDDIDYFTQSELLYALAGQMVQHLRSYLAEDEVISVLQGQAKLIAREIHAQMMAHFFEEAAGFEVRVSRGFTALKPCHFTAEAGKTHHFRETVADVSRIPSMLFGGFQKCLYPLQKFHSDTERRFAVILERDAQKWFRPVKGQFQIYYPSGTEQPEYIPDFVAETDGAILMVETKKRAELASGEVQAKAAAAARWCGQASGYAASAGGKPWHYLLIPHDEITEALHLRDFLRFAWQADSDA